MASASTKADATKSILELVTTLNSHEQDSDISSISYFPDGQRMISGTEDGTTRQWDLKAGREIEEARDVWNKRLEVWAVAVSRDGRWVVTAGGDDDTGELKACEVETGIVKEFKGHSEKIQSIDISADSKLLASGSFDETARIWNLETGKLVFGPFESDEFVGAVRFSIDSKKLAINSFSGTRLHVWDVKTQKLDARLGTAVDADGAGYTDAPIFWTNKNKNILAVFRFTDDDDATTIYEFDASTLETVGTPFEGHTDQINGLALSSDCTLLAGSSYDNTVKLWAFESRQLLASFDVQRPRALVLSPDSSQLAYVTPRNFRQRSYADYEINICNIPPDILAQARTSAQNNLKSTITDILRSDATRPPPAVRRRPPIPAIPMSQRPPPTINPHQPIFLRLRNLLPFPSRTNAVPAVQNNQTRGPLDFPATSALPSNAALSVQPTARIESFEISSPPPPSNGVARFMREHLSFLVPRHSHGPPVIDVAAGRKFTVTHFFLTSRFPFLICALQRLAAAKLPEYRKADDTRYPSGQRDIESSDNDSLPDVHWFKAFLCYYSCWSHGRLRKPPRWRLERVDIPRQDGAANSSHGVTSQPQPRAGPSRHENSVDILNRVAVRPPRVQHEEIELKPMANRSQPEAGPSRLVIIDEHLEAQSS
ncbi:hypothetical protein DEU56DRAFT_114266 [Suillus clintonianus]|uniref:uncharacterized protein n=1 Tax=Suillus clintonianus TaxID=1904413 RepID=UPI001B872872|nr:uncharacterized protein DEU56DRAFT_114266 [Suillus clintonianus]KAG2120391.1 hypothetical protein DEU56DRAFT_114266 [Suillus clintonianus]